MVRCWEILGRTRVGGELARDVRFWPISDMTATSALHRLRWRGLVCRNSAYGQWERLLSSSFSERCLPRCSLRSSSDSASRDHLDYRTTAKWERT